MNFINKMRTTLQKKYYLCTTNESKMKKRVEIKELLITDAVGIYTFQFVDNKHTEFMDFMLKYKNVQDEYVKDDFHRIIAMIQKISENGAQERLFRVSEGQMIDNVVAIPLDIRQRRDHETLRLYCVRFSDNFLIIGNGGTKFGNYNDNPDILKYTKDLANLERAIKYYIRKRNIHISSNKIFIDESINIEI